MEYPITDLDLAEYLVQDTLQIGEADTFYWELLGGKKQMTTKRLPSNSIIEEEEKWKEFEAHSCNVSGVRNKVRVR